MVQVVGAEALAKNASIFLPLEIVPLNEVSPMSITLMTSTSPELLLVTTSLPRDLGGPLLQLDNAMINRPSLRRCFIFAERLKCGTAGNRRLERSELVALSAVATTDLFAVGLIEDGWPQ